MAGSSGAVTVEPYALLFSAAASIWVLIAARQHQQSRTASATTGKRYLCPPWQKYRHTARRNLLLEHAQEESSAAMGRPYHLLAVFDRGAHPAKTSVPVPRCHLRQNCCKPAAHWFRLQKLLVLQRDWSRTSYRRSRMRSLATMSRKQR